MYMEHNRDLIISTLKNWAENLNSEAYFDQFYAFGSLIYNDGMEFVSGVSDIDIVCVFCANLDSPLDRIDALKSIKNHKLSFEKELLTVLSWENANKPIVSIVAITEFEMQHGIHKGKNPLFYNLTDFQDLLDLNVSSRPLNFGDHSTFHHNNRGAISSIFAAQSFRNNYLSISSNGACKVQEWNGEDIIPKDLAREAAQLRYYRQNLTDDTQFSVNYGTFYLLDILREYADLDSRYRNLLEWFMIKSSGKGQQRALAIDESLTLWEILYDSAKAAIEEKRTIGDQATNLETKYEFPRNTKYKYRVGLVDLGLGLTNLRYLSSSLNKTQTLFHFSCPDLPSTDDAVLTIEGIRNLAVC